MQYLIDNIERLTRWTGQIAAWIVVTLTISMLWEVVSRYVFDRPTIWAYEVAYMQMGALFVLGIAYTMQKDDHVRVDLLYGAFAPRGKAVANLIGLILLLPMVLWLCLGLWEYLLNAIKSGERSGESIWNPLVWPARVTFFVGFVLFALQTIAEILKSLRMLATGVANDPARTSPAAASAEKMT